MTATIEKPIALEITRHFDAAPERVFDAWLDGSWDNWAGPAGIKGELTLMEPRVGGRWRMVMHRPDGSSGAVGGVYKEIVRPSRLVMSWKWEPEGAETLITLTFKAAGKGTDLHMRHEGFAGEEYRDNHNKGWIGTLDKLAAFLA